MKIRGKLLLLVPLSIFLPDLVFTQERDVEGSKDHPLLSRMENFYISGYERYEYESHEFYDAQDNEYVIEGRKWVIEYTLKTGFGAPGQLKVRKNYINAIQNIGGTILFDRGLYMKVAGGRTATWIEVWVSDDGSDYTLTLVEEAAMQQEVVATPGLSVEKAKKTPITRPAGLATQEDEKKDPEIRQIEKALAMAKKNRDTVVANLKGVVQKVRNGLSMAFPDVAHTPPSSPAGPIPIPYPNIAMASDTAKGSKKVKIAAKAVALKNKSNFKKTESDEVGQKTQELAETIQNHYEKGTMREKDKVLWKEKLLDYQDQAAAIARALESYVAEIERLLAESKKESETR
jgi:hypothetical protein